MKTLVLGAGRNGRNGLTLTDPSTGAALLGVDWVTLDALPTVGADLVCTLGRDRIPLPDASVDFVFALHVIEHIGRQGEVESWFQFWGEAYRVMVAGAILQFECPHYTSPWCWADPSHTRAICRETFLYLNQDAYRQGGAIPDFRPPCDLVLHSWEADQDWCRGTLVARKPFVPYWID